MGLQRLVSVGDFIIFQLQFLYAIEVELSWLCSNICVSATREYEETQNSNSSVCTDCVKTNSNSIIEVLELNKRLSTKLST
jgi:hypothetical protein